MTTVTRMLVGAITVSALAAVGCGGSESGTAYASIKNDFNDPAIPGFQPPWTICRSSYLGVEFGQIALGDTTSGKQVESGMDNVLMVAAWDDPTCDPSHCLPIASKNAEEIVPGQHRTVVIGLSNHEGPCPPEGVAPIPQDLYDRILALWPEFGFKPYDQRAENPQCLP